MSDLVQGPPAYLPIVFLFLLVKAELKGTTISGLFNRNGIYNIFTRVFLLLGTGDAEINVPTAGLLKVLYIYKICSAFFHTFSGSVSLRIGA